MSLSLMRSSTAGAKLGGLSHTMSSKHEAKIINTTLARAPDVILMLIFQSCSKRELKCARIVCRAFERATTSLLFDEETISSSSESLRIARCIINTFSPLVRSIRYAPVVYREVPPCYFYFLTSHRKQFRYYHRAKEHSDRKYIPSMADTYLPCKIHTSMPKAVELICMLILDERMIYHRLQRDQQDNERNDLIAGTLRWAMRTLPHVKKLVFGTLERSNRPMNQIEPDYLRQLGLNERDICPLSDCPRSIPEDLKKIPCPNHVFYGMDPSVFWLPAMQALADIESSIIEIATDCPTSPSSSSGERMPITIFSPNALLSSGRLRSKFQCLTKLRLELKAKDQQEIDVYESGSMMRFLSSMRLNLESLYLSFQLRNSEGEDSLWHMDWERVLPERGMPALQNLLLDGVAVSERQMMKFLRGCPDLTSLMLAAMKMRQGSWPSLANNIRKKHRLNNVLFKYLKSNKVHIRNFADRVKWNFFGDYRAVNDFFLGDRAGENPFTFKAKWKSRDRRVGDSEVESLDNLSLSATYKVFNDFYESAKVLRGRALIAHRDRRRMLIRRSRSIIQ